MALVQITDPAFPGAKSIDFIGQRIVFVEPQGRYWGWSDLTDALSYNALNVAQAETTPDRIVGLCVSGNEVLIFGERTIEPWASAPTDTATFQLRAGSVIESGCGATDSIKRLDNSVFYLTNNGQVARLEGYTPRVVSTMAIEADIRERNWSKAFATTWEDNGHCVYYLTFPDGHTWGYDVRQGKWHRRESYGFNRWRVNCMVKSNGRWMAGDFQSGRVYEVEWRSVYESCEIMPRRFTSGVLHSATNRITVDAFSLTAATGQPALSPTSAPPPPPAFGSVLITGNNIAESGPKWAFAVPDASPEFVGIPISTGANTPLSMPRYYDGVWCSLADSNAVRYLEATEITTDSDWESASSGIDYPDALAAGPAGWITCRNSGFGSATAAPVPSSGFSALVFDVVEDGDLVQADLQAYANVCYTGGKYYANTTANADYVLVSNTDLTGDWELLVDRGEYPGDGYSGLGDICAFDGKLYSTHGVSTADYAFSVSEDGGYTWTNIITWVSGSGNPQPWQIETNGTTLLVLDTTAGWVWTSADGFAQARATGVLGLTNGARSRHIAYSSGYFFIVSGLNGANEITGTCDQCVTTTNGLTFNTPVTLPIKSVTGIAASSDPEEAEYIDDTCTPMEGGRFQLRYANDGAENWSNWRNFDAPVTGQFLQPLQAWRLGQARHRVWEVMDTSDRPQDVLAAQIIVSG